jgi:hypothetical protein
MTNNEYQDWLNNPSNPHIVLVEVTAAVAGVDTVRYLASRAYNTTASDTPANTPYLPFIESGMQITESLSLDGEASMSVGDVEIINVDGRFDAWLNDVWMNKPIKILFGSPYWPRSEMRLVFDGVVADIDVRNGDVINLKLRDKLQRLNTPISETKLGGTTSNKDAVLPELFGECHNITPLLVDPVTLEYQVNVGATESIFEARDNGVPVSNTVDLNTGKSRLASSPTGAVTFSAQGNKNEGYANTVASIIKRIVITRGKVTDRFALSDIDEANFATFDLLNQQPVGIYISERTNVLIACQELASSLGAQMVMSSAGKLRLVKIDFPAVGATFDIKEHHQMSPISISQRNPVAAAVKLGFCKNYTPQPDLQTGLPAEHKSMYATEFLTVTASDPTVQAAYKLDAEPVRQDTLLLTYTDAQAEANRRLNICKVTRTLYTFDATSALLTLELGQVVNVFNKRFGLQDGKAGVVVSLSKNYLSSSVNVGVLV